MTLKPRLVVGMLVGLGLLVFAAANAHLVHVAVTSQPDCVPHQKLGGTDGGKGQFSAAKSAC